MLILYYNLTIDGNTVLSRKKGLFLGNTLGENIKEARKMAELTQLELAKLTHLSRSYIGDIEQNRYNPSISTLKLIADATNQSLESLLRSNTKPEQTSAIEIFSKDLNKFLQQSEIIFDGDTYNLTNEERIIVIQSLKVAFYAAKKANKHKKDNAIK